MNTKEKTLGECRKKVVDEVERRVKRHPMGMPDPEFINLHTDLGIEAGYEAGKKDATKLVQGMDLAFQDFGYKAGYKAGRKDMAKELKKKIEKQIRIEKKRAISKRRAHGWDTTLIDIDNRLHISLELLNWVLKHLGEDEDA